MKRLVAFTPGIYEVGGAAKQSRVLLRGLVARGWSIFVVGRAAQGRRAKIVREGGLTVLEMPGFGIPVLGAVLYASVALPLGFWFGRRSQAILGFQLLSQAVVGLIVAILLRRPFLGWTTTSGPLSEAFYIQSARTARLRKKLMRRASFVVAQTEVAASEMAALVPADRLVVLPNPVELVDVPVLSGDPNVLYMGRFSQEKDLLRLLDAWVLVLEDVPAARLTLLGKGGLVRSVEPQLRHRVATDPLLTHSVEFKSWVDDVTPFLLRNDVFVFPSLTEGMSNALIEACARGRVVVASDIESNVEVLGSNYPLLFEAGNSTDMASALKVALADGDKRIAARNELERRMGAFSVDEVARRWERLIVDASDSARN